MAIQFKFFLIPITAPETAEAELNGFLRSVRALTIHREFINQGENSLWCLAVEYLPLIGERELKKGENRSKIDYREILSEADFALFAKLREWRKQAAGIEAVPVYTIFTNEQLAAISQKRTASLADLKTIEGIGDSRVSKYGEAVIRIVTVEKPATVGQQS